MKSDCIKTARIIFITGLLVLAGCSPIRIQMVTPTSSPAQPAAATSTPALASPIPATSTPMLASAPTTTSTEIPPEGLSVTLADNGKTVTLQVGERFLLNLGADYDWTVNIDNMAILSRVIGVLTIRGSQGLYEAHQLGETALTAVGDPACRQAQPPCGQPSVDFQVKVVVQSSGAASGQPVGLASIHMVSPTDGWATGWILQGTENNNLPPQNLNILRTSDGGAHWMSISLASISQNSATEAYFMDEMNAWMLASVNNSDGTSDLSVYHTTDGGATWQSGQVAHIQDGWPLGFSFADSEHGWLFVSAGIAAGSQPVSIYATSDGGISWTRIEFTSPEPGQSSPQSLPFSCDKNGVSFKDATTGWAAGSCPGGPLFLYVTRDGGKTWQSQSLPAPAGYPATLYSQCMCNVLPPEFPTPQDGFLAISIYENTQGGYLYATHDGGATWSAYQLPVSQPTGNLFFIDQSTGWLTDGTQIYRSRDGGKTWNAIGRFPGDHLEGSLDFIDASNGFLTDGQNLYATQDGGANWTTIQPLLAGKQPGVFSSPPGSAVTSTPSSSAQNIPLPVSREAIGFVRGAVSKAITVDLTQGQPLGYRLQAQARQTMWIMTNGDITMQVYDPQDSPISSAVKAPGPWSVELKNNGKYSLAVAGEGKATFSIYITPVGSNPLPPVPVPSSPRRLSFAQGTSALSFTANMDANLPQGYVLRALAGQQMLVKASGDVTLAVLDPDHHLVEATVPTSGQWQFSLPKDGDYTLVLLGLDQVDVTVSIP